MQTEMRARFQPITTAEMARSRLDTLAQGKMPIHDYVSAFRRLIVAVPDMNDAERLYRFKKGLRPAIAAQLRIHAVADLQTAIVAAVRVGTIGDFSATGAASSGADAMDLSLHAFAEVEGLERETDGGGAASSSPSSSAPITRSDLLELLNAVRDDRRGPSSRSSGDRDRRGGRGDQQRGRGLPTIPHLTPTQVQEYVDAGKCFGCGLKMSEPNGHYSNKCPNRKVDASGRVSWGK